MPTHEETQAQLNETLANTRAVEGVTRLLRDLEGASIAAAARTMGPAAWLACSEPTAETRQRIARAELVRIVWAAGVVLEDCTGEDLRAGLAAAVEAPCAR